MPYLISRVGSYYAEDIMQDVFLLILKQRKLNWKYKDRIFIIYLNRALGRWWRLKENKKKISDIDISIALANKESENEISFDIHQYKRDLTKERYTLLTYLSKGKDRIYYSKRYKKKISAVDRTYFRLKKNLKEFIYA